jgi:hypothetical protein
MSDVSRLLAEHVSFRCTSLDRIGVAGYIPGLMYEGGVVRFLLERGNPVPSPVILARNRDRMIAELDAMVADGELAVVRFKRGESKEEVARPWLARARAEGRTGVVLVGKSQERTAIWRGFPERSSPLAGPRHPHFAYRRQAGLPDHWYFYIWDGEWGPVLVKLCPFAPYPMWVNVNGHEWVKAHLDAAGVAYRAIDNGLGAVDDPGLAHRLCARLSAGHLQAGLQRWLSWLPSPLVDSDRAAGFGWDFSLRQIEISDTAVFDRPVNGRAWFEAAIKDHLDLGRPQEVSLIVNRRINRATPGRFETRVVTTDVDPEIRIRYKSDKVKAYFKQQRALRVETTINNPDDFGIRRRLCATNWNALRHVGIDTNARFLAALGEGQSRPPDPATLQAVVLPSVTHDGLRAPGLRFGDPRAMALLASTAAFDHVVGGLTNAGLCRQMTGLYHPGYNPRRATYDLRRLRRKGFIDRIEGTNTYQITSYGRATATFLTKLASRAVIPALTDLDNTTRPPPPQPRPLTTAWRAYDKQIDALIARCGLPA